MFWKCSALIEALCLVEAKTEREAMEKAEKVLREQLSNPDALPLDPAKISIEPFGFSGAKMKTNCPHYRGKAHV